MEKPDTIGVHTSHCCIIHGCKYGNNDCVDGIEIVDQIPRIISGELKTCPHCGYVL